jgi:hypothetical protein
MRLLERRFRASTGLEAAWAHLERVERWPSWAPHIRSVDLARPGPLAVGSRGIIRLTNGITSALKVTALES